MQSAQNSVEQAQAGLASQQASYASTAAPPIQADLDQAHAQVANAQSAVQLAQNNLNAAVLVAPTDGVVASISGAVGQLVSGGPSAASTSSSTTSSGNVIMTLTDISNPQVTAQVSEADIGRIQVGQPVSFTLTAFPGRTFTGSVAAVQPGGVTTSNVVTYNVLCNVDPADVQLLPSMTATVTITTEQDDNALLVPNSALSYAQTQSRGAASVYVMGNGVPTRVAVRTGSSDGQNTVVLSGVQAGQEVVTGTPSAAGQGSAARSGSVFGFGPGGGGGGRP